MAVAVSPLAPDPLAAPDSLEDGRASGAQLVYRRIHEAIVEGRLKPGARLTEASIAREIGLSRTPIREAMRQLEARGLLVHEPHRGMTIPVPDHQMVTELYQVREALEGSAAAMAATQASPAEVELLKEIVDAGRQGGDATAELVRNNAYFHNTVYRAAHNRYLLRTLAALQELADAAGALDAQPQIAPGRRLRRTRSHRGGDRGARQPGRRSRRAAAYPRRAQGAAAIAVRNRDGFRLSRAATSTCGGLRRRS